MDTPTALPYNKQSNTAKSLLPFGFSMMHRDKKLYWTADSPFCRIILWAWAESAVPPPQHLHLSWEELRSDTCSESIGCERTVPCLGGQPPLTDSMRILAVLSGPSFQPWLVSADGGLYRFCEGQLGRLMYSLYDGVSADRLHDKWKSNLATLERLLSGMAPAPTHGQIAMHTFLNFCIALQKDWWRDIPETLKQRLHLLEKSSSFLSLHQLISGHNQRVHCGFFSPAGSGSPDWDAR